LNQYIEAVHRTLTKGVNIKGYFAWSLIDNFEWVWGYSKKFGLIHINNETLKKTWKKNAYCYPDLIKANSLKI